MKCYFSTDITEDLSCSQDGKFYPNGFPIHICLQYPCTKYKELSQKRQKIKENQQAIPQQPQQLSP